MEIDDQASCTDHSLALSTYEARLDVLDRRIAELRHHREEVARAAHALSGLHQP